MELLSPSIHLSIYVSISRETHTGEPVLAVAGVDSTRLRQQSRGAAPTRLRFTWPLCAPRFPAFGLSARVLSRPKRTHRFR